MSRLVRDFVFLVGVVGWVVRIHDIWKCLGPHFSCPSLLAYTLLPEERESRPSNVLDRETRLYRDHSLHLYYKTTAFISTSDLPSVATAKTKFWNERDGQTGCADSPQHESAFLFNPAPGQPPSPNMLTLFCWLFGSDVTFSVKISPEQTVYDLQEVIIVKQPHSFPNTV